MSALMHVYLIVTFLNRLAIKNDKPIGFPLVRPSIISYIYILDPIPYGFAFSLVPAAPLVQCDRRCTCISYSVARAGLPPGNLLEKSDKIDCKMTKK